MSETLMLLQKLISINSVNPALVEGAPGETEIARFVADWCRARGLEVTWLEATPGRPSVVAIARGKGGGRSLMLNAHFDTVGVAGMTHPFEPRLEGSRLFGRGACDMKAGLVVSMIAVAQAAQMNLAGDVILAAVADEEHGSLGTVEVLERFVADAALLTEPTEMELCLAHRGFAVFEVTLEGKASHTSQPHLGINAITHAGAVLAAITVLEKAFQVASAHPLLGHGSIQVTQIEGGSELFTTPAQCKLLVERRTLPGEDLELIQQELSGLLEKVHSEISELKADIRVLLYRDALETSPDELIVQILRRNAQQILGRDPKIIGTPYWMDSGLYGAKGIPIAIFGVTGYGLHSTEEWVDIREVEQLEKILTQTIADFCKEAI